MRLRGVFMIFLEKVPRECSKNCFWANVCLYSYKTRQKSLELFKQCICSLYTLFNARFRRLPPQKFLKKLNYPLPPKNKSTALLDFFLPPLFGKPTIKNV